MQEGIRQESFQRNAGLEEMLRDLNGSLWPAEKECVEKEVREYPVLFVMSPGRTGTTLMMQWLASTGSFSYPTNLLSRFYGAPILGAKIQKLLTDKRYRFRDEFSDLVTDEWQDESFRSENGKTAGTLSPNEFWYFWRRFLPEDIWNYSSDSLWESVADRDMMRRELLGTAQELGKPFAMKGLIFNYHIPFLHRLFPGAIFLCMRRNLEEQIESMRKARIRMYGSDEIWYSFHIPEYEELRKIRDVREQIRGQLTAIYHAIECGTEQVPRNQVIRVEYEDFCARPEYYYDKIGEALNSVGWTELPEYRGRQKFENYDRKKRADHEEES